MNESFVIDPSLKKLLEDTIRDNDRLKAENQRLNEIISYIASMIALRDQKKP